MKTVLLVDDNSTNRLILSAVLEDDGYTVECAGSAAEAREKIAAEGASYDVVLLDQHLGDGLGTDLVASIRARWRGARVVLLSGSIDDLPEEASGLDAVALKGLPFPELVAILDGKVG